jgi:hypothetical protein
VSRKRRASSIGIFMLRPALGATGAVPSPAGRGVAVAMLAAASLLAPGVAGSAAAADGFSEDRSYRVDVTGIQVVDWRARSSWPLDDLAGWTSQDGTQTLGWQTTRTGTLEGTRYLRRRVGGVVLPPFAFTGTGRAPRIKGTVLRKSTVTARDPTPVCEGGDLDDECLVVPLTRGVAQACGRKTPQVRVVVSYAGDENEDLTVQTTAEIDALYPQCGPANGVMDLRPPTADSGRSPDQDLDVTFPNVSRRVARLRKGATLKLRREVRLGCPLPAIRPGYVDGCVTTDVTVELTRQR